jgi:septal ring factor EnvC (AmiA/AmiB activator)
MATSTSDAEKPDRAAVHRALQEMLRSPDTFATARHRIAESPRPWKRWLSPFAAKLVHFFAGPQVQWNVATARSIEATVRALDDGDRWVDRLGQQLRLAERRIERLETELRAAREAEEDARRKLAMLGVRLRRLEDGDPSLAPPGETR